MWQLSLPCGKNLATNIFKNNRPWLEVHHQHGLELSFGSFQLHLEIQINNQEKWGKHIIFVSIKVIIFSSSGKLLSALPLLRCQPFEWTLWLWSPPSPAPEEECMKSKPNININDVFKWANPYPNKPITTCLGSALAWIHNRPLSS